MQAESRALLTMEDSQMSVFAGTNPFVAEDSRMSGCAPLMPEELVEWRGGGNSSASLPPGSELMSSARDVSLDGSCLAGGVSRGGRLFGEHSSFGNDSRLPALSAGDEMLFDARGGVSLAAADNHASHSAHAMHAQWMQAENSNSSADGGVQPCTHSGESNGTQVVAGLDSAKSSKTKKTYAAKSAAKSKVGSVSGSKSVKDGGKNAKCVQVGMEGDGEGKLSGMWTGEENRVFFDALNQYGRSFPKIHEGLRTTKTREQVRCYYYRVIKKINQIIAPSGMKLDKTTGGASEGTGVIEAILAWWDCMRGMRIGNDEDTSANLFKRSAAITEEERFDFIQSIKRAGVNTTEPSARTSPGFLASEATYSAQCASSSPRQSKCSAANAVCTVFDSQSPHEPPSSAGAKKEAMRSSAGSTGLRATESAALSSSTSSLSSSSGTPEQQHPSFEHQDEGEELAQIPLTRKVSGFRSALEEQDNDKEPGYRVNIRAKDAGICKRTPLRHERVNVKDDAPLAVNGCNVSSPGSITQHGTVSGGLSGTAGTPRLKLKLLAVHPALASLIERCGFNAQLQLTFKPGGKSMGSIATHLASKWGKVAHEELLYLMPHRVDPAVPLVFQLLSNGDHGQGITWGPNDRDVQASDVYSDFGQPKVFQLSYGLLGFDTSVLDALALKLARYKPRHLASQTGGENEGSAGRTAMYSTGEAPNTNRNGKDFTTLADVVDVKSGQLKARKSHENTQATQVSTPAPDTWRGNESTRCADVMIPGMTASGRAGVLIKSPARTGMVNLVDFVPFLHHRSSNGNSNSGCETGDERLEQDPLDLSDVVPDTCTADREKFHAHSTSQGLRKDEHPADRNEAEHKTHDTIAFLSPPRESTFSNLCSSRDPQAICSSSRESRLWMTRNTSSSIKTECRHSESVTGEVRTSDGDAGRGFSIEEGLLGHGPANSRDVPILAPDSRDGLCTDSTDGLYAMSYDNSSMHAMLENSRQNVLEQNSSLHTRLLTDTCDGSLLGCNSRDAFGMMKRGREGDDLEHVWQRSVKRDM